MKLSHEEKYELEKFKKAQRFLSCDVTLKEDQERLIIWHQLKDKGLIRFKGNQENLQFFERVL